MNHEMPHGTTYNLRDSQFGQESGNKQSPEEVFGDYSA